MCLGGRIWNRVERGETEEWWPGTGLNRRRRPFQGRALPLSYLASVQTSLRVAISCADSDSSPARWDDPTSSALQQLDHSITTPDCGNQVTDIADIVDVDALIIPQWNGRQTKLLRSPQSPAPWLAWRASPSRMTGPWNAPSSLWVSLSRSAPLSTIGGTKASQLQTDPLVQAWSPCGPGTIGNRV